MIFLTSNFAINNIYLYDGKVFIKKNTVFNKIVPDFMDTLYIVNKTAPQYRPLRNTNIKCPCR